ncbi:MAG TPA: DNA-3-methyladenine glycosylase [Pseudolysinimonas sp.]|nr:DNA-3-methyladenine glycosylase [Pseudolysinimonas sp.]
MTDLATYLERPATEVAPLLLGAVLHGREVSVRLTEVEAYLGEKDPASHAFRGRTRRNAVMFGPAGHLYVYFTYGMHVCANVVCGAEGEATAVLLRAGEVVVGLEAARSRRVTSTRDVDLARGPARLCIALGLTLADDGARLGQQFRLDLPQHPPATVATGPRTGVSGEGGSDAYPWRFWVPGDPTVSPYKRHAPKRS